MNRRAFLKFIPIVGAALLIKNASLITVKSSQEAQDPPITGDYLLGPGTIFIQEKDGSWTKIGSCSNLTVTVTP